MSTPEEFFGRGLMEMAPPSPSVFVDLPPMAEGDGEEKLWLDDQVLPYISHVLMEDDANDDKLLYQYCDNPALQEVEQPFAQILCCASLDTNNDNARTMGSSVASQGVNSSNTEVPHSLLQGSSGDQGTRSSALSKSEDAVGAFLKGMEEGHRFLPKYNIFRGDKPVDQNLRENRNHGKLQKRRNREHVEEFGRASKAMTAIKGPEDIVARKMFDEMMVHGYETCMREMEKLRITKANEVVKTKIKGGRNAAKHVVDLRTLLIRCAQAVTANNHAGAYELLKQIRCHASAKGDATQRLAQCFADGLEARLSGAGSQANMSLMAKRTSIVEFLKAYKLYMAASCFNKVALIFTTMTIMHAMEGKTRLHIVDFNMNFGLQWFRLLHLLANRESGAPEVKMTAIGRPQQRSCPAEQIEETGCRLSDCARMFGLPLKFHAIIADPEAVCIEHLNTEADEVLIVHDLYTFSTLMDESTCFDDPNPRDTVLNNIRKMKPDVFIQSIVNCSYGTTFLTRFREALTHFTALFDMLEATIPRESEPRLVLEQDLLGRSVQNVVACEDADLVDHPEKYRQWQLRNQRAGLRQLPLNPDIIQVVRDKVGKCHHKDFLIGDDDQWLIQGWMGRVLFAHSTWVAKDE